MTAVVCCGLLGVAGSAYAVPTNGMIVFVKALGDTEGEAALHVMRADGSGSRPLFASAAGHALPRFSPDGNSLLYLDSCGPNCTELRTTTLAGGTERIIASGFRILAAWAPDSTRLVYARIPQAGGDVEIRTVSADGSGNAPVIVEPRGCVYPEFGAGVFWSAATNRILYACPSTSGLVLISIAPDGTGRQSLGALPNVAGSFDAPDLSHDGTTFVGRSGPDLISWVFPNGAVTPLTSDGEGLGGELVEEWPTWAPDGSRVLFAGLNPRVIATVSNNGSGQSTLRPSGGDEYHFDWQPCEPGVTVTCEPTTLAGGVTSGPPPAGDGGGGGAGGSTAPGTFEEAPVLAKRAAKQDGKAAFKVKVGCDDRSITPCGVAVTAKTANAVTAAAKKAKKLVVARAKATIAPGKTKTVKLKLSKAGRKVLKRTGKLALRITVSSTRSDGSKRTASTKLTMRAQRK